MGKSRKVYQTNFKKNVVKQYEDGMTANEIKVKFDVPNATLYKWIKSYGTINIIDPNTGEANQTSNAEIQAMQKRIKDLEEDNEILKKAMSIFAKK